MPFPHYITLFIGFILLIILNGLIDGYAFDFSFQAWQSNDWNQRLLTMLKAVALFNIGLILYMVINFLATKLGIKNSFIVVLLWFTFTIISVALIKGRFLELPAIDKAISLAVVILISLLYFRGVAGN